MFFDVGNSKQSLRELKERVWSTTFDISYSSIFGKTERVEISVPSLPRDYVNELI